jgi:hypothetical protein
MVSTESETQRKEGHAGRGSFGMHRRAMSYSSSYVMRTAALVRHAFDRFNRKVRTCDSPRVRLPTILIASIPKSGTIYLNQMLTMGLGLKSTTVSPNYVPADPVDREALERIATGNHVVNGHIECSGHNLQLLRSALSRWVVHVRDPRSALLSWVHHLDRMRTSAPRTLLNIYPMPDDQYFAMEFPEKLRWNVNHFLPYAVSWIGDWLQVVDRKPGNILLTTYDELHGDELSLALRILDFFGIPRACFHKPEIEKKVEVCNFRKGLTAEWRAVFPASVLERCNEIIGTALLERFGWSAA